MNAAQPSRDREFALRWVWHIVDAGPLRGPKVGDFYLFKCFRWAAVGDVRGLLRGRLPANEQLCVRCGEVDRQPAELRDSVAQAYALGIGSGAA